MDGIEGDVPAAVQMNRADCPGETTYSVCCTWTVGTPPPPDVPPSTENKSPENVYKLFNFVDEYNGKF